MAAAGAQFHETLSDPAPQAAPDTGLLGESIRMIAAGYRPLADRARAVAAIGLMLSARGAAGLPAPLGRASVEIAKGGTWQPQRDGRPAVVLPLIELDPDGRTLIYDILAWAENDPATVWRRTDIADTLGDHHLDDAWKDRRPVRLFRTAAGWHAAAGDGVCILDIDINERWRKLEGIPTVICDDQAHGRWVHRLTRRPIKRELPRVVAAKAREAAA